MTDVELVLSAYAAYARGDIEDAVHGLHPDVEWIEPPEFANGGLRRGRASVAEYLRLSRDSWEELTVEPKAQLRGDDIVIVVRHHGRRVGGELADVTVADVFTVRDGEVVKMKAYADPDEPLR